MMWVRKFIKLIKTNLHGPRKRISDTEGKLPEQIQPYPPKKLVESILDPLLIHSQMRPTNKKQHENSLDTAPFKTP
jgi:hypothetical protein